MTLDQLYAEKKRIEHRIAFINVNCDGIIRLKGELQKVESRIRYEEQKVRRVKVTR